MTEPSDLLWEATEYVTRDRVRRYAQVSGDANAIHLSDEAAKAAGLPSAIAHGYLILGIVLHHADHWAAANGVRITECDTRFVRPVHLGSAPAELVVAGVRKVPGLILASAAVRGTDATTRAVLRPIRITYEPSAPRD